MKREIYKSECKINCAFIIVAICYLLIALCNTDLVNLFFASIVRLSNV